MVQIYAAPHLTAIGAGEYAANITDYVMAFLEDRFKVKYPIKKLYSIALPQFFFSAMENLGMITYKFVTTALLIFYEISIKELVLCPAGNRFYFISRMKQQKKKDTR